jgi:hypothetical protein
MTRIPTATSRRARRLTAALALAMLACLAAGPVASADSGGLSRQVLYQDGPGNR